MTHSLCWLNKANDSLSRIENASTIFDNASLYLFLNAMFVEQRH
jgi:hypothetical protein